MFFRPFPGSLQSTLTPVGTRPRPPTLWFLYVPVPKGPSAGVPGTHTRGPAPASSRPFPASCPVPHLLKELQTVGVVVVRKVHHAWLAGVARESLAQPAQGQVALHGAPRDARVTGVAAQLVVAGRLHVQMCVVEAGVAQQARGERRPARRVLHHQPVQVGHVQQCVGHACQLGLLHRAAVGGRHHVDGGQRVRPRRGPRVHVLRAHHLHDVAVRHAVLPGVGARGRVAPGVTAVICRVGRHTVWGRAAQAWLGRRDWAGGHPPF